MWEGVAHKLSNTVHARCAGVITLRCRAKQGAVVPHRQPHRPNKE